MQLLRFRLAISLFACIALASCASSQSTTSLEATNLPSTQVRASKALPPGVTQPGKGLWVATQKDNKLRHFVGAKNLCVNYGSGGFSGLSIDASGNIYIAEFNDQQIGVYSASTCDFEFNLPDGGYMPLDVAVARDGTVAITNEYSTSLGAGNVTFISSSGGTRTATGLLSNFYFGAFDKRGNLYTDGFTASGSVAVGVVAPGSAVVKATEISGIGYPGGIQVAKDGTVNVDDQACSCIKMFKNGSNVGTVDLDGTADAISFAFNRMNTKLWVADYTSGTVSEYAYPAGGAALRVLNGLNGPLGVGVDPASKP